MGVIIKVYTALSMAKWTKRLPSERKETGKHKTFLFLRGAPGYG
jgi:hypothetical protein